MIIQYTAFDKKTGAVRHCGSCSEIDLTHHSVEDAIMVGGFYDPEQYYMDLTTEKVMKKETFAGFADDFIAVGDVAHGKGPVPPGTMITVGDSEEVEIDDGTVEFEPQHAGAFYIKLEGVRLMKWEGRIDAY